MTTQPTPSPHQHEPAPFTTGKFKSDANFILDGSVDIGRFDLAALSREEAYGNASLTATCFNSATALHEAGYAHGSWHNSPISDARNEPNE